MQAKSLSTSVQQAREKATRLAFHFFLQERARLLLAPVPLEAGRVGQLSLTLSSLQKGSLGSSRNHGQGISALASL